jgi:hypothetical protein
MAQTFSVPSRQYPAGVTAIGPFALAAGTTRILVTMTHGTWPLTQDDLMLQATFEVSFDNGATWEPFVSVGWGGGTLPLDRNGNPQSANFLNTSIVTPCRLRGTVDVAQAITTAIAVVLT